MKNHTDIQDFQASKEASSPQKRTSSASKHDFLTFFVGLLCRLDPENPQTQLNPDQSETGFGTPYL
jgi:hypothetical protein